MNGTMLRPTKVCPTCGHSLTMDYFRQKQRTCDVCVGAAEKARPWTDEHIERMRLAVRRVGTYYASHWQHMTKPERDVFCELINAIDRRKTSGGDDES
jgi:hypothetical protein